jgi:hypothetical protein
VSRTFRLIVTDASPLITLAAADALECLTMPGLPVIIPDMVYMEVTRDLARLGAAGVVAWARAHHGHVVIAPTEVFAEFQAVLTVQPQVRSQGRGEQAALEVLAAQVAADPELHALLLFEDNDVRSRGFLTALPERVMALSTGEFLVELEAAGRIQSSDRILDEAAQHGRNIATAAGRKRGDAPAASPAASTAPRRTGDRAGLSSHDVDRSSPAA